MLATIIGYYLRIGRIRLKGRYAICVVPVMLILSSGVIGINYYLVSVFLPLDGSYIYVIGLNHILGLIGCSIAGMYMQIRR